MGQTRLANNFRVEITFRIQDSVKQPLKCFCGYLTDKVEQGRMHICEIGILLLIAGGIEDPLPSTVAHDLPRTRNTSPWTPFSAEEFANAKRTKSGKMPGLGIPAGEAWRQIWQALSAGEPAEEPRPAIKRLLQRLADGPNLVISYLAKRALSQPVTWEALEATKAQDYMLYCRRCTESDPVCTKLCQPHIRDADVTGFEPSLQLEKGIKDMTQSWVAINVHTLEMTKSPDEVSSLTRSNEISATLYPEDSFTTPLRQRRAAVTQ